MNGSRRGEIIVNTHSGRSKPDDEQFDPNRHGHRCYHGTDVAEAINHWGTFNGRDHDKRTALGVVRAIEPQAGPVFEVFHIGMYVAVLFEDDIDLIGAYISTGFVDTRVQAVDTQFFIERGYWRHEFSGYGRHSAAAGHSGAGAAVPTAECPCSPGFRAPVGSNCPYCELPIGDSMR